MTDALYKRLKDAETERDKARAQVSTARTELGIALLERDRLREALTKTRDDLEAITHCYVCRGIFAYDFREHHEDCLPDETDVRAPDVMAMFDRIDAALAGKEGA